VFYKIMDSYQYLLVGSAIFLFEYYSWPNYLRETTMYDSLVAGD